MRYSSVTWDELPVMLNTKQVAELLGYGQQTVRELCHARQIPHLKFGRAFMFPRDTLKHWVESVAGRNCKYNA